MSELGIIELFVLGALGAPALLLAVLGGSALVGRAFSEGLTGFLVRFAFLISFVCFAGAAFIRIPLGLSRTALSLGEWFSLGEYHFQLRFVIDRLSLTFALFTSALCGVVAAFAHRYLHREKGYHRFFVLLSLFATGMLIVVLADSIEVVFAGWEMVGLSSSLLVAFFHYRTAAVENGLRTFIVYRASDVGLLSCAVLVHHFIGTGDFEGFLGEAAWPAGHVTLTTAQSTVLAILLLFSVMGKSAQMPFSGWLPRAMEGPTPSSAIFYGALSVHAGAYLLLRAGPLLESAPLAELLVVLVGLLTAIYATFVGRVQSDVKASLAFASLTQVGIILVEIGLGFRYIALIHIVGHASVRSLQFLRAPSMLRDVHQLENTTGGHLSATGRHYRRFIPNQLEKQLYRFSLERGYLDSFLDRFLVEPFLSLFRRFDSLERRLCAFLSKERGEVTKALPARAEKEQGQ